MGLHFHKSKPLKARILQIDSHENLLNIMETSPNIMNEDEFLRSERRLFNRRGSDESTYSTTSAASQEPPKEGKPEYSGNPSWNTGLLNPEAQEFIPKTTESTSPAGTPGRKTGKKNKKKSPTHRCCQHCYKMGYDEAMYGSHSMRKKTKEIICPILLANICKSCGDTGDRDIHEDANCPLRGFQPFIVGKLFS